MSADEQQAVEDGEQRGPFGGLSPAEARARRTEIEAQRKELEKLDPQSRIVAALMPLAEKGNPQAVRELRELGVLTRQEHRTPDQRLLALLSPAQRICIQKALQGERVDKSLALSAWA